MKFENNQKLIIILPSKDATANTTAGEIREKENESVFNYSLNQALNKLEYLIDIGCYSTNVVITGDVPIDSIGWLINDVVLALPDDPMLKLANVEKVVVA